MKCRNVKQIGNNKHIVYFGSYGKTIIADGYTQNSGTTGSVTFTTPFVKQGDYQQSITFSGTVTNINGANITVSGGGNSYTINIPFNGEYVTYEQTSSKTAYESEISFLASGGETTATFTTTDFADGQFTIDAMELSTHTSAENYSEEINAVENSLYQRLSVIQNELWWDRFYGIPYGEKKQSIDLAIVDIINSHSEITSIKSFTSSQTGNNYTADFIATSIYGDVSLVV